MEFSLDLHDNVRRSVDGAARAGLPQEGPSSDDAIKRLRRALLREAPIMLHRVTLIAILALAPLTAFADILPRTAKDWGLPAVGCVREPPCLTIDGPRTPGWADEFDLRSSKPEPRPDLRPDSSGELVLPRLVVPTGWRPNGDHVSFIGR